MWKKKFTFDTSQINFKRSNFSIFSKNAKKTGYELRINSKFYSNYWGTKTHFEVTWFNFILSLYRGRNRRSQNSSKKTSTPNWFLLSINSNPIIFINKWNKFSEDFKPIVYLLPLEKLTVLLLIFFTIIHTNHSSSKILFYNK